MSYVYKIRRATDYSIKDLEEDSISASTPECFDDTTEMEWYCDNDKLAITLENKMNLGVLTKNEFNKLFDFKPKYMNDKDVRKVIADVINPKDVPQKKSLLVSCLSEKNFVLDDDMWELYTGYKQFEGIMLVYDMNCLINICRNINGVEYGNITYDSRKNLDLTNYWVDWLYCYCKYVDYSKEMLDNKNFVDTKLRGLNNSYLPIRDLVFTKNEEWKWQKEWRIAIDNKNYSYEKGSYAIGDEIINDKSPKIKECKYGYSIKAKPVAIYVRKHVYKKYLARIEKYAMNNGIRIFYESKNQAAEFESIYN